MAFDQSERVLYQIYIIITGCFWRDYHAVRLVGKTHSSSRLFRSVLIHTIALWAMTLNFFKLSAWGTPRNKTAGGQSVESIECLLSLSLAGSQNASYKQQTQTKYFEREIDNFAILTRSTRSRLMSLWNMILFARTTMKHFWPNFMVMKTAKVLNWTKTDCKTFSINSSFYDFILQCNFSRLRVFSLSLITQLFYVTTL